MKKILINGGCGFLGSNLAEYGLKNAYEITIFDNLQRNGSANNLSWLQSIGNVKFIHGDVRNKNDVEVAIKQGSFDAVFHLSGQVAMTTSIENPYRDFEINTLGTLNLLDCVRKYSKETAVFFSSTNKVYGDLEQYEYTETKTRYVCKEYENGFDERVPLDFRSPYGCSKGAADQYMQDYAKTFGLKTVVFRHSSMYGSRQFATVDQGWIGWFCIKALEQCKNGKATPFSISGNGKQVRDVLHSDDMNLLYYKALDNIEKIKGNVYNIGGGKEQSLSLLELFEILEKSLDIKLNYSQLPFRLSDQKVFIADINKIYNDIGWMPKVNKEQGITKMLKWVGDL